jgi:predicted permease
VADVRVIGARLEKDYPVDNAGRTLRVDRLSDVLHGTTSGSPVLALTALTMLGVGIILVIACINLANLLLARSAYRQREIGIRMALGGSRSRVIRQLLTETMVLALVSGVLGFLGARWLRDVLWSLRPANFPADSLELSLDWRVLLFTFLMSLAAGIVIGFTPAIRATRSAVNRTLHGSEGAMLASGWSRNRLRTALLISEVSLSVVSLVCAGLFFRVLQKATTIDMGYDWTKIADIQIDLKASGYSPAQGQQFYRDATERAASVPGIEAVAIQTGRGTFGGALFTEDGEHIPGYRPAPTTNASISTNYFSMLGVSIVAGRGFNNDDRPGSAPVAIISRSTADYFWPGQNPIGKRFHFYGETTMREVVGVVPTTGYWMTKTPPLAVYLPLQQVYEAIGSIQIRASRLLPALLMQARSAIQSIDARAQITAVRTIKNDLDESMRPIRIITAALTTAGLIALAISIIGIYGVMAYSVAQRTQELGVRMALGVRRFDLLGLVVRQAMGIAGIGIIAGLLMARAFTPLFARLLPLQVQPGDVYAFLGSAAVVFAISVIASYIPARRAARVDPLVTLRYE